MVVSPPPVRAVRPHRVLRQLARPARHRARRRDRTSLDHQLRAGRTLVLRLSRPTVLRQRPPTHTAGPSPTGSADARTRRTRPCQLATAAALTPPTHHGATNLGFRRITTGRVGTR